MEGAWGGISFTGNLGRYVQIISELGHLSLYGPQWYRGEPGSRGEALVPGTLKDG